VINSSIDLHKLLCDALCAADGALRSGAPADLSPYWRPIEDAWLDGDNRGPFLDVFLYLLEIEDHLNGLAIVDMDFVRENRKEVQKMVDKVWSVTPTSLSDQAADCV
jgi:hypothetical protein